MILSHIITYLLHRIVFQINEAYAYVQGLIPYFAAS